MAGEGTSVSFLAFVDESESRQDADPGTYMLCATVLDSAREADVRDRMRSLKRSSQKKVHWRDEQTTAGRRALVSEVTELEAEHIIVVRIGDTETPPERRRRICLERLCYELHQLGVSRVIFESRGPGDKRDRHLIDVMRSTHVISSALRVDHLPGPAEPLLWIPDIVCGAVTQDRIGYPDFLAPLLGSVTLIDVRR